MLRISVPHALLAGVLPITIAVGGAPRADAGQADRATQASATAHTAAKTKACRRGQTRVRLKRRTQCISTRTLFRGQPKDTAALASRIVGSSRRVDTAARGKKSIAALLGTDAAAIAKWEDAVAKAGLSATDRRLAAATAAQAQPGQEETLGLPTIPSLSELVQKASTAIGLEPKSGAQNAQARATVKASLNGKGTNYQFEIDETKPQGIYCPNKKGQVMAHGGVKARRDAVRDGETVTEGFNATYSVLGTVDADGNLKSYDISVTWETATGTVTGIKPTAVGVPIINAKSIDIKWPQGSRSKELEFGMAEVMRYAQEQALRHLDKAQDEWNKAASCVRVESTPKVVKGGTSANVTIKTFSRITGQPIESDVTLAPSGGATVAPARIKTTPAKPGKTKVTMPKKGKGTRAHAAAVAKVAVTARSPQGVGRASIGSTELPEAFDVALDLNGLGLFATHQSSGTLNAAWRATGDSTAAAATWTGETSAIWANLTVTSLIDECFFDTPVAGAGPVSVTIVANDDGDQVTVTFAYGAGTGVVSVLASSFTVHCTGGPPPPPPIPGQPGPSMVAVGPTSFTLPITGGSQSLASSAEVQLGADGFFTTGTLRLTPVP